MPICQVGPCVLHPEMLGLILTGSKPLTYFDNMSAVKKRKGDCCLVVMTMCHGIWCIACDNISMYFVISLFMFPFDCIVVSDNSSIPPAGLLMHTDRCKVHKHVTTYPTMPHF